MSAVQIPPNPKLILFSLARAVAKKVTTPKAPKVHAKKAATKKHTKKAAKKSTKKAAPKKHAKKASVKKSA